MIGEASGITNGWTVPVLTDAESERFRSLIHRETGIYMHQSKRHLLVSRLAQRLRQLGMNTFSQYYDHLIADASGQEKVAFINRITTNKTSFFREPHHFEFLVDQVLPQIRRSRDLRLRVWSAACSSGEEPYSVAMVLREALGYMAGWDVRILASDIDTDKLAAAASGIYPVESLEGVSAERLRTNFRRGYGDRQGLVQVRPELQRLIRFQRINLTEPVWPVQEQFDVVFCRNVIIYFNRATQQEVVERLASCLRPGGYFFCGHSENLSWIHSGLETVQPTVYRWKGTGGR